MKRALFAIASVGIITTAVGVEAANAQYGPPPPGYGPSPAYGPSPTYTPPSTLYPPPRYTRGGSTYPPLPTYTRGGPGYGYGPGPYPDAVIVNPVTGRWCRTESNGYQFCWTP
jgi:hypothetical protein